MNNLPLIEKYRAKKFSEIKGQSTVISQILSFYKMFPKKKALILTGPAGTGKTSFAIALANEFDLELFELNASDLRNKLKLEEVLKPAIYQSSLFKKGKLILMDEADGITGTDRGGLPELIALIEKTSSPIIITANDIWQQKFSLLRRKCQLITLKEPSSLIILEILKEIVIKEGKNVGISTLELITKKSKGDIRAALNDLQIALNFGEQEFILDNQEREKEESIFEVLKKVFQSPPEKDILGIYDKTNLQLDEIILWIEENIPEAYSGQALTKAFEALSKADIFKGRIYRQQHWRFLIYENFFLSAGICSATKLKTKKFTKYNKPSRILKIWLSNQKNAKKKSIVAKYSQLTHMSKKKAMKESFLLPLIISEKEHKKLDLNSEEIAYLNEKKQMLLNTLK
jgi:replication factor C large subunit